MVRSRVNGKALDEPYIYPGDTPCDDMPFGPFKVPDGKIWVMGDHRQNSQDSRYHKQLAHEGFVPVDEVVGRAVVVAWPVDRWATLPDAGHLRAAWSGGPRRPWRPRRSASPGRCRSCSGAGGGREGLDPARKGDLTVGHELLLHQSRHRLSPARGSARGPAGPEAARSLGPSGMRDDGFGAARRYRKALEPPLGPLGEHADRTGGRFVGDGRAGASAPVGGKAIGERQ